MPPLDGKPDNQRLSTVTQDSPALPSAYDSYWNGSPKVTNPGQQASQTVPGSSYDVSPEVSPPQPQGPIESIPTPVTARPEHARDGSGSAPDSGRHMLQQRFSWETPLQNAGSQQHVSPPSTTGTPAAKDPGMVGSQTSIHAPMAELDVGRQPAEPDFRGSDSRSGLDKELPQNPGSSSPEGIRPVLSNTTDSLNDVTGGRPGAAQSHDALVQPVPRGSAGAPLPPAPFTTQPQKAPGFKEIMTLRSPMERIQKLDLAREQVANEDTGLEQWILQTAEHVQDYADILKTGALPSGVNMPAGSSKAPVPSSSFSTPGSGTGTSPANSKPRPLSNTTKTKDIFSSGAMLGGKSKAKELFAKGRSRFRSSGGEKVDH